MLKTKVNDLVVYYSEDDDIDTIIRVIKNNYDMLFVDYVNNGYSFSTIPIDDDMCVHTDDFQKDIATLMEQYYYSTGDACLGEHENLAALYATLLLQMSGVKNPFFKMDYKESAEMIDTVIAKQYYLANGTAEEFSEYAKYRDPEEAKKIITWLRETCRYETYNFILGRVAEFLKDNGFDYLATSTSNNIFIDVIKNYDGQKEEKIELPKMSPEEIDRTFYDFLKYIHAPDSWRRIYNSLKRKNAITYTITDGKEYACCSKNDIDEDYSIEIEYNGTTTGFCSLVHEFIHYITFCTGKLNFSLAEFPSIYFEKAAAYFLRERGYSEEVVVDTILQRNVNNIEILMALSTIFTDVNAYMKKGIVTREDKIALWQDQMMGVYKLRQQCNEKLEALGKKVEPLAPFPSIEEIERDVDLDCDESTKQFIVSDLFLLDGYQYLLGTSLAESIINKHGRTSLPGMIEVVYDLPSHDANSIAEKFGIVKESGKENNMKKEKDIN